MLHRDTPTLEAETPHAPLQAPVEQARIRDVDLTSLDPDRQHCICGVSGCETQSGIDLTAAITIHPCALHVTFNTARPSPLMSKHQNSRVT